MPSVYFNGPVGRVEGRYHASDSKTAPMALVLHPDPTQGGTMNNKVAFTLFSALRDVGFSVLRINMPGVGGSTGVMGTIEDDYRTACSALDWLRHSHPDATSVFITGYSRGSNIAAHVASRRPEVENYIFVAPPIRNYDFNFFIPAPLPGLVIAAENDELVLEAELRKAVAGWFRRQEFRVDYIMIEDAKHDFEGKLDVLYQHCVDYLKEQLSMKVLKPVKKKRRRRKKREVDYDDID